MTWQHLFYSYLFQKYQVSIPLDYCLTVAKYHLRSCQTMQNKVLYVSKQISKIKTQNSFKCELIFFLCIRGYLITHFVSYTYTLSVYSSKWRLQLLKQIDDLMLFLLLVYLNSFREIFQRFIKAVIRTRKHFVFFACFFCFVLFVFFFSCHLFDFIHFIEHEILQMKSRLHATSHMENNITTIHTHWILDETIRRHFNLFDFPFLLLK